MAPIDVKKGQVVWVIDWTCQLRPGLIIKVFPSTSESKILIDEQVQIFANEFLYETKEHALNSLNIFTKDV